MSRDHRQGRVHILYANNRQDIIRDFRTLVIIMQCEGDDCAVCALSQFSPEQHSQEERPCQETTDRAEYTFCMQITDKTLFETFRLL